jgi:ABC-type bacteriocin/lantibiotic exporter with double-glycine peptidase domain
MWKLERIRKIVLTIANILNRVFVIIFFVLLSFYKMYLLLIAFFKCNLYYYGGIKCIELFFYCF